MVTDNRPAMRAMRVEETPEPFRRLLWVHFSPQDPIRLLAFSPSRTSQGVRSPATLLTLSDRRWLLISDDEYGRLAVVECAYDDTLLVELTEILLYGQLRIDFAAGGESRACHVEFNTVMDGLYRAAAREILRGIERRTTLAPAENPPSVPGIETWPIAFRNAVPELLPKGRLVGAVRWPAVHGGFGRELAPAAALLITDREILLVSEEKAWSTGPRQAKYGRVATYFPLARLARFGFREGERLSILDLEMHAIHGGETLQIPFPSERAQEVAHVVEQALQRRSDASCDPDARGTDRTVR